MPKKTRKLPPPDKGDTISIYFHADVRAKILEIPPRSRGKDIALVNLTPRLRKCAGRQIN